MPTLLMGESRQQDSVKGRNITIMTNNNTQKLCDEILNGSNCISGVVVIGWNNGMAIALYIVEFVALFAVLLSLLYFLNSRNSLMIRSCYSRPDNAVLAVLCSFCLLPLMHIGELSPWRCLILWSAVNTSFVSYSALLLTKTLFVQNLLKCKVLNEHPNRRMAFSVFIVILQLIILITIPISGFLTSLRSSCSSGGMVVPRNFPISISVLGSLAYNWLLLFVLCTVAVVETAKHRGNVRRTQNLAVVAFVGISSYTYLICCVYFELQLKNYTLVTLILCASYLINPVVCLSMLYLPIVYFIFRSIRHERNFQKHDLAMSPRRDLCTIDEIFNYSCETMFGAEQTLSSVNLSVVSRSSLPSSLFCAKRESTYDNFKFGSNQESVRVHQEGSCESVYDNVPRPFASKTTSELSLKQVSIPKQDNRNIPDDELTREELTVWLSFLRGLKSSDV